MELRPEREGDRLRTVPRSDDRDALRREEAEALAERLRIPRRLDDEIRTTPPCRGADGVAELFGSQRLEPTHVGGFAAPRLRIASKDDRATSCEKDGGEDPDRAEADDGRNLAIANAGVKRDLKRRLHEREERRGARVALADAHNVGVRDREAGLVWVERKNALSLADGAP